MRIWKNDFTLEQLNHSSKNTLVESMQIEFSGFGDDFLEAIMPVTAKHVQPFRILHGGASVVLAETLGSVASVACLENVKTQMPVGLEINANHLKSVPEGGQVRGVCKAIRIGRSVHVWDIKIYNQNGDLVCVSRLTVAIVPRK